MLVPEDEKLRIEEDKLVKLTEELKGSVVYEEDKDTPEVYPVFADFGDEKLNKKDFPELPSFEDLPTLLAYYRDISQSEPVEDAETEIAANTILARTVYLEDIIHSRVSILECTGWLIISWDLFNPNEAEEENLPDI